MSHILAIDTSTDACSVAILTPSGIQQVHTIAPREHTQRLLPSVEGLLAESGLSLKQFDAIAFGVGPGSFTGLRIGLSTAQGLAYGADLPLIPISTLKAMAQTAMRVGLAEVSQVIVPMIDARMNEVYCSAYQQDQETGQLVELQKETIISPEDVIASPWLSEMQGFAAVGSGWHYDCLSTAQAKAVTIDAYPEAHDMAILAQTILEQDGNDAMLSPLAAVPTYMRDEISWKKRQRIRDKSL